MDQKKTYEAMFLLDAGGADFEAAAEPARKVLARSEAEILAFKPWDERKLAYDIAGRRRGLYALAYLKVDPSRVAEIEHDCQLDERILRVLILRRDSLTEEEINAETPATTSARKAAERKATKAAEEEELAEAREAEAREAEAEEAPDAEEAAVDEGGEEPQDEPGADVKEDMVDLTSDEETDSP